MEKEVGIKVGIFIICRLASSRLPLKALLTIKGHRVIEYLIEWAKRAENIDEVVLCTTENKEDRALAEIAIRNDIICFGGSEKDIIKRMLDAAYVFGIDFIIMLEGDAIFYDKKYIDLVTHMAKNNPIYDIICTHDLPFGVNVFGCTRETLEKVLEESIEDGWMNLFSNHNFNRCVIATREEDRLDCRLTIDYPEDFELHKAIIESFNGEVFGITEVINYLKNNPELMKINEKYNF